VAIGEDLNRVRAGIQKFLKFSVDRTARKYRELRLAPSAVARFMSVRRTHFYRNLRKNTL